MGRADVAISNAGIAQAEAVEVEIEEMNARPDDIPADVWELIQENGQLATERLNQLLKSQKFTRYRPADQARLIALAQNRAYGAPKTNREQANRKRAGSGNVVASELNALVGKTTLPEYKQAIIDVEFEEDTKTST